MRKPENVTAFSKLPRATIQLAIPDSFEDFSIEDTEGEDRDDDSEEYSGVVDVVSARIVALIMCSKDSTKHYAHLMQLASILRGVTSQ